MWNENPAKYTMMDLKLPQPKGIQVRHVHLVKMPDYDYDPRRDEDTYKEEQCEWEGRAAAEVEECKEDIRKRLAAFDRGEWGFVGVRAGANLYVPKGSPSATTQSYQVIEVQSMGLWGYEDDMGDKDFKEVGDEQLDDLRETLEGFGIPKARIDEAFAKVEWTSGEAASNPGVTTRDIEQWIDNDEGLYNWWRGSRLSKREFIKENREELVRVIGNVLEGRKPAHYLAYGPRSNPKVVIKWEKVSRDKWEGTQCYRAAEIERDEEGYTWSLWGPGSREPGMVDATETLAEAKEMVVEMIEGEMGQMASNPHEPEILFRLSTSSLEDAAAGGPEADQHFGMALGYWGSMTGEEREDYRQRFPVVAEALDRERMPDPHLLAANLPASAANPPRKEFWNRPQMGRDLVAIRAGARKTGRGVKKGAKKAWPKVKRGAGKAWKWSKPRLKHALTIPRTARANPLVEDAIPIALLEDFAENPRSYREMERLILRFADQAVSRRLRGESYDREAAIAWGLLYEALTKKETGDFEKSYPKTAYFIGNHGVVGDDAMQAAFDEITKARPGRMKANPLDEEEIQLEADMIVLREGGEEALANPFRDKPDVEAARELYLFIRGGPTHNLYRQQMKPIIKNLMRKREASKFDFEKSVTLWGYLAENAARMIESGREEAFSRAPIPTWLTKATRMLTARQLAADFVRAAEAGDFNWVVKTETKKKLSKEYHQFYPDLDDKRWREQWDMYWEWSEGQPDKATLARWFESPWESMTSVRPQSWWHKAAEEYTTFDVTADNPMKILPAGSDALPFN